MACPTERSAASAASATGSSERRVARRRRGTELTLFPEDLPLRRLHFLTVAVKGQKELFLADTPSPFGCFFLLLTNEMHAVTFHLSGR